jgi:hypothetical protein
MDMAAVVMSCYVMFAPRSCVRWVDSFIQLIGWYYFKGRGAYTCREFIGLYTRGPTSILAGGPVTNPHYRGRGPP